MAITAVARKLVTVAYRMLKNNEPYRSARPELMRAKFATLRARDGVAPEGPGPLRLLTSAGVRLPEVYGAAGLPPATPPHELPAGERRMLAIRGIEGFVAGLYEAAGSDPGVRGPGRSTEAEGRSDNGEPPGWAASIMLYFRYWNLCRIAANTVIAWSTEAIVSS